MSTDVVAAFNTLSIIAVVFSSLSAFYGAYVVLFVMSIWATYRYTSVAQRRMRQVSVLLFVVLGVHYLARSIHFAQSRNLSHAGDGDVARTIPLVFIIEFSSTVAGTISDGLLAWRFYVLHDRTLWALYLPTVAIIMNTMLGLSGDFQHLAFYHNAAAYINHIEEVACQINAAWGWCMLGINTFLSGAMITKILRISRTTNPPVGENPAKYPYSIVLEAIAESALVTWVGLLLYGIASLVPQGHITTRMNVGYVMECILPMCFGISQCLITTRLGFAVEGPFLGPTGARWLGIRYSDCSCARANEKGIAVMVHRETVTDNLDNFNFQASMKENEGKNESVGDLDDERCETPLSLG